MNRIKLIAEVAILAVVPLVTHHHAKIDTWHKAPTSTKKPGIIKPSHSTIKKLDGGGAITAKQSDNVGKAMPEPGTTPGGGQSASNNTAPTTGDIPGGSLSSPTTNPTIAPQSQIIKNITFYGWPDNDPPGGNIAYPVIHNKAGGTGTYSDPLTFATKSTFPKGTILYVPYIQKYVIMEDECTSCGASHIDIWVPSNGLFDKQVLACENKWTRTNQEVILNPPVDDPVGTSLFDVLTGTCA